MMLPFSTGHGPKTFTASLLQTNVPVTKCYVCLTGHLLVWDSLHGCHNNRASKACNILCSASRERRGFGPQPKKKDKLHNVKPPREGASNATQNSRKLNSRQTDMLIGQSPGLANSGLNGKSGNAVSDRQFEEKLEAVKRSAMEQRKAEETKAYQAIDYDAPIESNQSTIGLGAKVGVGLAVLVFGLVFALGDFLPSGSENPNEEGAKVEMRLTEEEKAPLQARLQQYEAKLRISPKDLDAIEGAAVTLSELGEYKRAASLLEKLTQERPSDSEAFRLLGEIKYELKDYEGSASAYRSSASVSQTINLEVLRGLTNSLLAAQKPDEAVQVLLATHESLNSRSLKGQSIQADGRGDSGMPIDPIQVELLLGKAYSDWGHVSDAVSVYDRLISMYPNDFRGYLAKGILLKENDKVGDAERMFIQARFFAPEKAKALVDRYSRQ